MKNMNRIGKIIIPGNMKPWPHEMLAARILSENGYDIIFVRKREEYKVNSADFILNNDSRIWELKSPKANNLKALERNMKRGRNQSSNIIISGLRFSNFSDEVIIREIKSKLRIIEGIEHLKYISKIKTVIDIK